LSNANFNWNGITPYFGGNVGIGYRKDKGLRKNVSTSVNRYTYITTEDLSTLRTPDIAEFEDNTKWVETGFSIGLQWFPSENLRVKGGYKYEYRTYNVKYRLDRSPEILNDIDINQRYNGWEASVSYSF